MIVKRWIGSAEIGYRTMMMMEIKADLITILNRAVYEALAEYMEKHTKEFLDYPQNVFTEKFLNKVERLCDPYFNCYNNEIRKDTLKVTIQNTHYPKIKSGVPEIAFLIAS